MAKERGGGHHRNKRDEKWNARFKELLDYISEHGDCNVPLSQDKLGKWVYTQRTSYAAGSLSRDRNDRLDSIGFKWDLVNKYLIVPWETRFNELVRYKAKHGDCNVPTESGKLGTWVSKQRQQYKNDKLSQDRIDRLNSISFDWTPPRGRSRKRKSLPSIKQNRSSSRKKRASLLSTTVESLSDVAGAETVGEGRDVTSLSHSNPSRSHHNLGVESDDDVDEIGALIYDQVMQRRQDINGARPELCLSNAAGYDIETDSEIEMITVKSEDAPIKAEECETDEESDAPIHTEECETDEASGAPIKTEECETDEEP